MSVFLMASIAHLLVRFLYDASRTYIGYQKRNIIHTPLNAELRVLACAHRSDDALAIIKLLELTNPTRECPLAIYALHLVELVGRATPLLINHGLGQRNTTGTTSRSQLVIDLFQNFGDNYHGSVSMQTFTAMSLPKFMHHDICSLGFDKLTSLIILPFHRKWSQQGKVILDSSIQRAINQQVIDMAPCSVGILIDRRKIRHHEENKYDPSSNEYNVCVIFLGGSDDREALAYAKRMIVKSLRVSLTVIRFVAANAGHENQWDTILDTETLRDIKLQASHQNNIVYREVKSKDGPDTALLINEMMEGGDFDMIMVGRRPSEDSPLLSGLTEWSDLPELGPIGDILASSDIQKPISVLVVQQQILMGK